MAESYIPKEAMCPTNQNRICPFRLNLINLLGQPKVTTDTPLVEALSSEVHLPRQNLELNLRNHAKAAAEECPDSDSECPNTAPVRTPRN